MKVISCAFIKSIATFTAINAAEKPVITGTIMFKFRIIAPIKSTKLLMFLIICGKSSSSLSIPLSKNSVIDFAKLPKLSSKFSLFFTKSVIFMIDWLNPMVNSSM